MSAAVTLVDRLYIHGASRSAQVALLDPDTAISWGELEARSNRIANALMNVGVSRGTRAAVLGGSNATAALVILSVLKAGASVVPLPTLLDAGAILRMIGDSESRVLFAAPAISSPPASRGSAGGNEGCSRFRGIRVAVCAGFRFRSR